MDIITYCSKNYEWVLKKTIASWQSFGGAQIYVYTDGTIDIDNINQSRICSPNTDWKSNTFNKILAFENHLDFKNNFVFLDVDCILRSNINDVFDCDFSLAVTGDKKFINSGVVFCKFSEDLRVLISSWKIEAERIYKMEKFAEQKALLNLFNSDRFKMIALPIATYNSYVGFKNNFSKENDHKNWIDLIKIKSKIVHFQGLGHFDRFYDIDRLIKMFSAHKIYI